MYTEFLSSDSAVHQQRGQEKLKRLFIPFAIVYGQVTAAVITVTFVLYGLSEPRGQSICASLGLSLVPCRALAALVIVLAFGLSVVLTLSRFRDRGGS